MQRTGECLEEELNIITRDSWGAKQPRKRVSMITPVDYFIIHHSAGFLDNRACDNLLDCIEEVKDIQKEHMDNGYVDIGYHYLIGGDGSVFEGRGWQYEGAHAFSYYNNISIGVCLIGNFNGKKPTNKATTALSKLNTCLQRIGKLNLTHSVYGHRDVRQTECPGDKYYPTLKETFGASWHREYPPPEYWSECRVNEGKCQNDALDCEGEYKVRTTKIGILPFGLHALPFGTLLCPEHEEDNRIKCCIKRT
ncbi:peptidoglycan-recognition protein SC2-like [Pecten maximus]|uniref:peptidoglycan-recognition protein SC2-like n=1 Tax=Pecten maximus TaxID=6579 RepID=UPI001458F107|nr:peptidoglycan-recognition protein SC2-like [Pecten maximus]